MAPFNLFRKKPGKDDAKLVISEKYLSKPELEQLKKLILRKDLFFVEGSYGTSGGFLEDDNYFYIDANKQELKSKATAINEKIAQGIKSEKFNAFSQSARKKIFKLIAPNIIGRDDIKLAGLLQLFSKEKIHILLLGDPSTGKTVILRSVSDLAPISSFGLGSGTSKAGLTVAMSGKDIIKGILPLADDGIACIDELNLMRKEDLAGLLNAMEKGFITYDKGSKHLKLDARVKIFASANPAGDKFKGSSLEDLKKQIPFEDALLSRFHMIFILRKPSTQEFLRITQKIISGEKTEANKGDLDFASEYIEYALGIEPKLGDKESSQIQEFVAKIKEDEEKFLVEVSPRIVVGLINLAKAAARLRLSEKVEPEDIALATSVIKAALYNQM